MSKPENYPVITALICTLNERKNISDVLTQIPEWIDEIVLVDGHSSDGTVEAAKEVRPGINVIYQTGIGKGDALQYGINQARGDIIVTLDADGATDPKVLDSFIQPLLEGYDFAKGSRFLHTTPRNKPFHRIIGNWIIILTFNLLFFCWYTDLCSGYNAFWKKSIDKINPWPDDGYENEPFINCRVRKRRLKTIEVTHQDNGRLDGEVKEHSWRQGIKAIKTILRERFTG